jgi:hypothetical protein
MFTLRRLSVAIGCVVFGTATLASPAGRGAPLEGSKGVPNSADLEERLERLDALFGTSPSKASGASAAPRTRTVSASSTEDAAGRAREFARSRLGQSSFYDTVLGKMFESIVQARKGADTVTPLAVLKSAQSGPRTFYFLRQPCVATEQVEVHPWWSPKETVWVCRDSYRPNATVDARRIDKSFCEGFRFPPDDTSPCGCGAQLFNCARDEAQHAAIIKAAVEEPVRTLEYVIKNHEPLSNALTMRESVRSDLGNFFYVRNAAFHRDQTEGARTNEAGALSMDVKPSLRPRGAEFAGGILTTPALRWFDQPRNVMATLFSDFTCVPFISVAVTAPEILHLQD